MKEINQLIHLTSDIQILKSILKNGFYTSYAKETFGGKSILIPMISFANILYRDIGNDQVINYGNYGLVFNRDYAINKFDLNPVTYIRNEGIIEKSIKDNLETSILPQTLHIVKDFYTKGKFDKITNHINFNPLSDKIKTLLDNMDKNINDEFIESLQKIFGDYFTNSLHQLLLAKPYKVVNKIGETKIAYNEREWRKSFLELHYIQEITPSGKINDEYTKWINTPKPHFKNKYILNFSLSDIDSIIVKEANEIEEIKSLLSKENTIPSNLIINTLENFKSLENKNGK